MLPTEGHYENILENLEGDLSEDGTEEELRNVVELLGYLSSYVPVRMSSRGGIEQLPWAAWREALMDAAHALAEIREVIYGTELRSFSELENSPTMFLITALDIAVEEINSELGDAGQGAAVSPPDSSLDAHLDELILGTTAGNVSEPANSPALADPFEAVRDPAFVWGRQWGHNRLAWGNNGTPFGGVAHPPPGTEESPEPVQDNNDRPRRAILTEEDDDITE